MSSFGDALIQDREEVTERWYTAWRCSPHPHLNVGEAALKDHLSVQLKVIGEGLCDLRDAEEPGEIWQVTERLDPEARVSQEIPIEEVVREYRIVVDVIRPWVRDRGLQVSFDEYSYFYQSIFELTAESVRRYTIYQAEKVARDRAYYLAGLAHQMRSPLSSLSLQLQMLQRSAKVPADLLGPSLRSVRRMTSLIESVMRLERFKPEELPVRPRCLRPANLIDEVLDDRRAEAGSKGLRLEIRANRSLEMDVDEHLFVDALGNLLDNAIKYTESGFVRVEVEEEDDHVLFKVRDSGVGISKERQAELFRPLKSARPNGLGIGLHIARRAVIAQRGEIGVESQPGHGALFWFRLPRKVAVSN
ncbi:sensor histidine kinase KdpD [Alkalilimnicola ehrlichii]|uniref:sensor histidine kinase n=1 Tax=Alkalilimnicola ehrlichii TaxID=351052 RepID=UPI0015F2984C|nr:HAMP domain-containing sensor histidine kinase [Alkalilimnicola ehrlichii]